MTYEKSCGAVVYKIDQEQRLYLIEHMALGHTSIPKGHVEEGETEEQTAIREIKEETNLDVVLDTRFRHTISYSPYPGIHKEVVFFIAEAASDSLINQECEVSSLEWLPYDEACSAMTYDSDRETLAAAKKYLEENIVIHDDGIPLRAVLEKPEGADQCPIVIMLHGFTSAKDRPHNIAAAAAMRKAGYATLRFDLYGHGESGGEFRKHTLYKWISNTMTVIDFVRKLGYTDLYLSGHSQGGLVAALAAGMEADRIKGLILRSPAFMIPQAARDGSILGVTFDPDHVPDSMTVIKGLELDGNYIRVAQTIHAEEAADRYKGSVLILHGDEDDTVPLEDSQRMAMRYHHCELAVMHGETHHFDQHTEQMQEIIQNWMVKQREDQC